MKKITAIILTAFLALSLTACQQNNKETSSSSNTSSNSSATTSSTVSATSKEESSTNKIGKLTQSNFGSLFSGSYYIDLSMTVQLPESNVSSSSGSTQTSESSSSITPMTYKYTIA